MVFKAVYVLKNNDVVICQYLFLRDVRIRGNLVLKIYEKQLFKGFETCHIWPETCYDARYHTSVGNVVLLPREVAGLTDHCQAVEDLLKYEAWKRFRFKPDEEAVPSKPKNYNKIIWRN